MPPKSPSSARSSPKSPHAVLQSLRGSPKPAPAAPPPRPASLPSALAAAPVDPDAHAEAVLSTAHSALAAVVVVADMASSLPLGIGECVSIVSAIVALADQAVICKAEARRLAMRCDELVAGIKGNMGDGSESVPDSWAKNVTQLQNNLVEVQRVLTTLAKRGFFYVVIHHTAITDQLDVATNHIQDSVMAFMIGSMIAQGAWAKQMADARERDTAALSQQMHAISAKLDAMQSREQVLDALQIQSGEEEQSVVELHDALQTVRDAGTMTDHPSQAIITEATAAAVKGNRRRPSFGKRMAVAFNRRVVLPSRASAPAAIPTADQPAPIPVPVMATPSNVTFGNAGDSPHIFGDPGQAEMVVLGAGSSANPASPTAYRRSRSYDVPPSPILGEAEFYRKALNAFRRTGVFTSDEHESI
ncbi:hypothetical protein Q5752_002259 [Cryptotrichosporon argae]